MSKETRSATAGSLHPREPESPPLVRWEVGSLEYNRAVLVVGIGSTHKASWGSRTRVRGLESVGASIGGVLRCRQGLGSYKTGFRSMKSRFRKRSRSR